MANIPQKSTDPTEAALSAIQEALKSNEPGRPSPPGETTPAGTGAPLALPDDLFESEPQLRPANDDRAAIGQILQALRRRPARTPYIVAALAAALWSAGGLSTAYLFRAELLSLYASPRAGFALVVALAAAVLVPALFFIVLAHMVRRSQDLRIVAESMAEVAMHLSQPEAEGRDAVVTVGQAVRREVAAMGDGIERALARAGELEVLVHNEVSALERAYSDNEVRIRDLLRELTSQRETLVTQAEQVRNAISSVHLDLAHDITSVGDLVSDKVNDVAQHVTHTLTEKGEHITLALARLPARHAHAGVLLTNPGGPGASGVDFASQATNAFDAKVLDHFDIVSWDPRGVSRSAPVNCLDNLDAFFANPRVQALVKPPGRFIRLKRRPSYISSRTFALTLLDTFAPPQDATAAPPVRNR